MHYAVGQEVYGGHIIADILEETTKFVILIRKFNEVKRWKSFNKNMGIAVEYNIDFE